MKFIFLRIAQIFGFAATTNKKNKKKAPPSRGNRRKRSHYSPPSSSCYTNEIKEKQQQKNKEFKARFKQESSLLNGGSKERYYKDRVTGESVLCKNYEKLCNGVCEAVMINDLPCWLRDKLNNLSQNGLIYFQRKGCGLTRNMRKLIKAEGNGRAYDHISNKMYVGSELVKMVDFISKQGGIWCCYRLLWNFLDPYENNPDENENNLTVKQGVT